jgi:hypothetical protein
MTYATLAKTTAGRYLERSKRRLKPPSFLEVERHLRRRWSPLKEPPRHSVRCFDMAARLSIAASSLADIIRKQMFGVKKQEIPRITSYMEGAAFRRRLRTGLDLSALLQILRLTAIDVGTAMPEHRHTSRCSFGCDHGERRSSEGELKSTI